MKRGLAIRIRIEVDPASSGERVVADWLRSWRRHGVGPDSKQLYPNQGASITRYFHAPPEAVTDLELRLASVASYATFTREPSDDVKC